MLRSHVRSLYGPLWTAHTHTHTHTQKAFIGYILYKVTRYPNIPPVKPVAENLASSGNENPQKKNFITQPASILLSHQVIPVICLRD
jgi:hypothetical protein